MTTTLRSYHLIINRTIAMILAVFVTIYANSVKKRAPIDADIVSDLVSPCSVICRRLLSLPFHCTTHPSQSIIYCSQSSIENSRNPHLFTYCFSRHRFQYFKGELCFIYSDFNC